MNCANMMVNQYVDHRLVHCPWDIGDIVSYLCWMKLGHPVLSAGFGEVGMLTFGKGKESWCEE